MNRFHILWPNSSTACEAAVSEREEISANAISLATGRVKYRDSGIKHCADVEHTWKFRVDNARSIAVGRKLDRERIPWRERGHYLARRGAPGKLSPTHGSIHLNPQSLRH
jgi:hypothetical protein